MTSVQKDLVALVMKGAGLSDKAELPFHPKWDEIHALAGQQALLGIVGSAVPEEAQALFFNDTLSIVRQNKRHNELLGHLTALLRQHSIPFVLQKGQGVAQCYPNPMLRMSGDIDLLFPPEYITKARNLLAQHATRIGEEIFDGGHIEVFFGDILVELHSVEFKDLSDSSMCKYSELVNQLFANEKQFGTFECEGQQIPVAPVTFDAFYLFLHIVKHYYTKGVGIRQFLDLRLFLTRYHSEIDFPQLNSWVEELGMQEEWQVFTQMWDNLDNVIWDVIFLQGNMGTGIVIAHRKSFLVHTMNVMRREYCKALRYKPFSYASFLRHLYENTRDAIIHEYRRRKRF